MLRLSTSLRAIESQVRHSRLTLAFLGQGANARVDHARTGSALTVCTAHTPEVAPSATARLDYCQDGIEADEHVALCVDVADDMQACIEVVTPLCLRDAGDTGGPQRIGTHLRVGPEADLEYRAAPVLVGNGARYQGSTRIDLAREASFTGWEIVALGGRQGCPPFLRGDACHRLAIWREGAPVLAERFDVGVASPCRDMGWGWSGSAVWGVWVSTSIAPEGGLEHLAALAGNVAGATFTCQRGLLVARYRGQDADAAHRYFCALSSVIPRVFSREVDRSTRFEVA